MRERGLAEGCEGVEVNGKAVRARYENRVGVYGCEECEAVDVVEESGLHGGRKRD